MSNGNHWDCPMCGGLGIDTGCDDDFGDVCDECAAPLFATAERFPQAPLSLTPKEADGYPVPGRHREGA